MQQHERTTSKVHHASGSAGGADELTALRAARASRRSRACTADDRASLQVVRAPPKLSQSKASCQEYFKRVPLNQNWLQAAALRYN